MKGELLLKIKTAEEAAGARVAQAQEEAKAIVAEARRKAETAHADGVAAADAAAAELVASARSAAQADAKKVLTKAGHSAEALEQRFNEGIDGVVDRVLKVFEGSL